MLLAHPQSIHSPQFICSLKSITISAQSSVLWLILSLSLSVHLPVYQFTSISVFSLLAYPASSVYPFTPVYQLSLQSVSSSSVYPFTPVYQLSLQSVSLSSVYPFTPVYQLSFQSVSLSSVYPFTPVYQLSFQSVSLSIKLLGIDHYLQGGGAKKSVNSSVYFSSPPPPPPPLKAVTLFAHSRVKTTPKLSVPPPLSKQGLKFCHF